MMDAHRRWRITATLRRWAAALAITLIAATVPACTTKPPLLRLAQARERAADLLVQFLSAADASNKAVMSDSDEVAAKFVRDAEGAKKAVQADTDLLRQVLRDLAYEPEANLLETFTSRFAEYQALDEQVLALTTQNTNRLAQRLSFGPAQKEADAFADALALTHAARNENEWRVKALGATSVATIRELQSLHAPHIGEVDDAAMTRLEQRMATASKLARDDLRALGPMLGVASQPQLSAATAALDRFMTIHAQILDYSRRNTNVRSLALALNDKGRLAGACEDTLRVLRDAVAKRGLAGTR